MKKKFKILLILFISIIILTGCTTEKRNEIVCNDIPECEVFNKLADLIKIKDIRFLSQGKIIKVYMTSPNMFARKNGKEKT